MEVGDIVELLYVPRQIRVELVAIIPANERPNPRNVWMWYHDRTHENKIPVIFYQPSAVKRYVFSRGEGVDGFVILPEPLLDRAVRTVLQS